MADNRDLRVLFSTEVTSDSYSSCKTMKITGYFVTFEDGHVRNVSDWDDAALADLALTAYMSTDETGRDGKPWGWACEYRQVYSVRLERAQAMARTLAKVQRAQDKLTAAGEWPESFPYWARAVAKVLGATSFGWHVGPLPRGAWSHDEYNYRWGGPTDLAWQLKARYEEMAGKSEVDA